MAKSNNRNETKGVTLLGLGPGSPGALTREAWEWLEKLDTLYLRTMSHPTVANLPDGLNWSRLMRFTKNTTHLKTSMLRSLRSS